MKYDKLTAEELLKELTGRDETIAGLQVENKQAQKELAGAVKANEVLVKKLEKLPAVQSAGKKALPKGHHKTLEFQHNDTTYGFKLPVVTHKNTKVTAAMVAADAKLQAEFVAMASGMIYRK